MVGGMNLYLDNCRPAVFAAGWIPGRLLAVIDIALYPTTNDYLYKGLSDKFRQHYNKAGRLGYYTTVDDYNYRNEHIEDIRQINVSMPVRQGRPMDPHYAEPQQFGPSLFCDRHKFVLILVVHNDKIVAYMELYIVGEFSHTSRVLGHADHLRNGVMPMLFTKALEVVRDAGCRYFCYGEWHSGTDGLKFFKRSTGFKQMHLG